MAFGVTVTTGEAPQSSGFPTTTGNAFFVGRADQGPATAVACHSINDYINAFGPRTTGSATLYDAVDVFLREGGQLCYVARDTDSTATTAALTLSDAAHPSVVVSALTPGLAGNSTYVAVTNRTATTFTADTTSASPNLANISSVANLGVGTPVTGTGVPANTYILSVNTAARTAVMTANATATATGVTLTPSTFTVSVQDSNANVLEAHGPFRSTSLLFAETSAYVTFTQSAASGFTANVPVASAAAPLTGGADASDLTDATAVATLTAAFPATLGPGQVALPGYTSTTAWTGLDAHARATNRYAIKDTADQPTAAAAIAATSTWGVTTNGSYGFFTDGTCIAPGLIPSTTRTVASSAVAAALCARVAATGNDNQAPAGPRWALNYVTGFTSPRSATDIASLNAAGISPWRNLNGTLSLYGFVTPVLQTTNQIFWSAAAGRERMSLVARGQAIADQFMFAVIDGQGLTLTDYKGDLQALIANDWGNGALFGATALEAGTVQVGSPVNTTATEALGQLNAVMNVRISPFVQAVTELIISYPITATLS